MSSIPARGAAFLQLLSSHPKTVNPIKRFARLFEFETGQLLLTISEISDLPGTTMSIETQHDGVSIGTGLSFTNRLEAQAAMDEVSTGKAQELHQAIIACITDPGQ